MKKYLHKVSISLVLLMSLTQQAQAGSLLEEFIPIKEFKAMLSGTTNYQPQREMAGMDSHESVAAKQEMQKQNEHQALIDTCKVSLANLYEESINPPRTFTFNQVNVIENEAAKNLLVHFDYETEKGTEHIEQKFMCEFVSESNYQEKNWHLVTETTSY